MPWLIWKLEKKRGLQIPSLSLKVSLLYISSVLFFLLSKSEVCPMFAQFSLSINRSAWPSFSKGRLQYRLLGIAKWVIWWMALYILKQPVAKQNLILDVVKRIYSFLTFLLFKKMKLQILIIWIFRKWFFGFWCKPWWWWPMEEMMTKKVCLPVFDYDDPPFDTRSNIKR